MPEAAAALLQRGFEELGMTTIWCGYYDGNQKSRRVQEKLGFQYDHSFEANLAPLIHEVRVCHASKMTKVPGKMEDIHA